MAIRGIVVDVSRTLLTDRGPVDGLGEFWAACKDQGLKIIVASNQPQEVRRLRALGFKGDFEATPWSVRARKPSPEFVAVPARALGLEIRDLVYLGDDDFNDAVCASHAKIPYLRAAWANLTGQYGIPVDSLTSAARFIDLFLTKEHPWFWMADGRDSAGRAFTYRAIVDCRTVDVDQARIKAAAVRVLKDGTNVRLRPFFNYHLLTSLYLGGLVDNLDLWTTYPSHDQGSRGHSVLAPFLQDVSKQFRDSYLPLLVRHTESQSSRRQRWKSSTPTFEEQVRTVKVDEQYIGRIGGRRVLVVDDFTTGGLTFEWARNILYAAGASDVIGVAIGKFGQACPIVTPIAGAVIDPLQPAAALSPDGPFPFQRDEFDRWKTDEQANDELQASMARFEA